nr:hypothetical protein BaRGS_020132 [Batillaria attramentaria]
MARTHARGKMSQFLHEIDRFGNDMWFGDAGDIKMPPLVIIHDYKKMLQRIKELQLRSDDVLVVGYPKTGTSLSPDRASLTDYTKGFFYDEVVLLVSRSTAEAGWTFFLQPFHWLVYTVIGVSLMLVTALHVCLARIQRAKEAGLMDYWLRKYFPDRTRCEKDRKSTSVPLYLLQSAFVVAAVGLAIAALVLGIEYLADRNRY